MDGHSATNARLLADSGAEALFIRNVDPQDRQKRLDTKSMEYIWRPNFQHLGRKSELFTHVFYDFDMSPFDLDVMDPPQNKTDEYHIDPKEWEWYWGNNTDMEDWWWGNDTFDDDWNWWEDGEEQDWWNNDFNQTWNDTATNDTEIDDFWGDNTDVEKEQPSLLKKA